jgi:predicted RNase H-like HicB family nuclease
VTPEQYLAIPYILEADSVQQADGRWVRRLTYPELPGCFGESESTLEALDRLEAARRQYILDRLERGDPVPVPRLPLRQPS